MALLPANRRRLIWSLAAFPLYVAAASVGGGRETGNPVELCLGWMFCGIFISVFTYPVILLIQFLAARAIRKLSCGKPNEFTAWEFAGVALVCLLWLWPFLRTGDRDYYRRFVSDDAPASLSAFQCRFGSGFGSTHWAIAFRADPDEFGKALSRYAYFQEKCEKRFCDLQPSDDVLRLDLPDEPVDAVYRYNQIHDHGSRSISIYTNAARNFVFIAGNSD